MQGKFGWLVKLLLCLMPLWVFGQKPTAPKPLTGLVLILDPGHGGEDPGSHGKFQGENVYEAPYTLDQAYRIKYFAEQAGAKVYMTVYSEKVGGHRNWSASKILPLERDVYFSLGDQQVKAGRGGLERRVDYANKVTKKQKNAQVVFLAIHFDIAAEDSRGAFIITPKEYTPTVAGYLVKALDNLASTRPLRPAGHDGRKNIQILRSKNVVHEKVLIELGNFKNAHDNFTIRNYETRNRFAIRLVNALVKFHQVRE